jgi:hypothetical protein
MRVWPLEVALRREISNHRVLRRLDAVRGERHGEGARQSASGGDWEGERELFAVEVSKSIEMASKLGCGSDPRMSLADIRLLARWCPACRRREPGLRLSRGTWEGEALTLSLQEWGGERERAQAAETVRR